MVERAALPPLSPLPLLGLLLGDGRWPGGGYAHSGGLEAAVADGSVRDITDLEAFATGRLATSGPLDAWLAVAACRSCSPGAPAGVAAPAAPAGLDALAGLDEIADASTPVPALRATSRALGRGLRRSATAMWPALAVYGGEHHAVVIGAVAALTGLGPAAAGSLAVHSLVTGVLIAAPKLLAVDTVDALAIAVRLAPFAETIVAEALTCTEAPIRSAPLHDARSDRHSRQEMRLYAS